MNSKNAERGYRCRPQASSQGAAELIISTYLTYVFWTKAKLGAYENSLGRMFSKFHFPYWC